LRQLPDRGLHRSWLLKSVLWTTLTPTTWKTPRTLANYPRFQAWSVESLREPHPQRRRSRSPGPPPPVWDRADVVHCGRLPTVALPVLTALIWVEEGVVHGSAGPLFRRFACRCLASHNRQNMTDGRGRCCLETRHLRPALMEAAFRLPGVPHRLEKIRDLAVASWYNDSKATKTTDAAEVGPRRPARSDGGCSPVGQVKQGRSPGLVEGPRSARPGPSVLYLAEGPPKNVCCPLLSALRAGEVPCLGGPQRGRLLEAGPALSPAVTTATVLPSHQPVTSLRSIRRLRSPRESTSLPLSRHSNPDGHGLMVGEERADVMASTNLPRRAARSGTASAITGA